MRKHLGATLVNILFHLCESGQFYLGPSLVIPLRCTDMDVWRAASIWKIKVNPHDIELVDISSVVF